MPSSRNIRLPEDTYQKAQRLRDRLLQAGVTRVENGKVVPMTLGRVVDEALDLLEKASKPRRG